jgi:coproporphyrinogen III oxidase
MINQINNICNFVLKIFESRMALSETYKKMEDFISNLQNEICGSIEASDSQKFIEDIWHREEGGGGKTRVIEKGLIFEKGGVNISSVHGVMPESVAKQFDLEVQNFAACGLSIVIHPYSPRVPTIHMNIRYFETEKGKSWFGGGIDLTPYHPFIEDFKHFHSVLKEACESAVPNSYKKFKEECDEYFFIKHRNEMRGIGGIFFDYLDGKEEQNFKLVKNIGKSFLKSYLPIVEKRKDEIFSKEEKHFQLIRRGRYVEFNLIYDRGTLFGLRTGGRIESILISLPPEVKYEYNFIPAKGSVQFEMMQYYQPLEWIKD